MRTISSYGSENTCLDLLFIGSDTSNFDYVNKIIVDNCPKVKEVNCAIGITQNIQKLPETNPDLVFIDFCNTTFNDRIFKILNEYEGDCVLLVEEDFNSEMGLENFKLIRKPFDPLNLILEVEKTRNLTISKPLELHSNEMKEPSEIYGKITIPTQSGYEFIKLKEIVVIFALGNYCRLHLRNGQTIMTSITLKQIEKGLPAEYFFRTHRSYTVNVNFASKFLNRNGGIIVLENGLEISVSRRKREEFLNLMKIRT